MSEVTIAEAVRLTGKDRRTIERHLKSGHLSYTTDHGKRRMIETSELMRVYGEIRIPAAVKVPEVDHGTPQAPDTPPQADSNAARLAILEAENAALRERLADKEKHLEDLRGAIRLLEYKQTTPPPEAEVKTPWWKRKVF